MASIREEAERLSRVLNDRSRGQEIHGGFRDGSVVINGATFMADDVIAIMRGALNHSLGNPEADDAVSLDRHDRPFFMIERFDDFRVHGFGANHIQRIGRMMARAWQQFLKDSGRTYHDASEVPAIGVRFTAAGMGEFKAALVLCREIALVRACHDGATLYEPGANDVIDLATAEHGVTLSPGEAAALLEGFDRDEITRYAIEGGLDWERQRERARDAVSIALAGRDLARFTDEGRVARPLTRDEVERAVLVDYELCRDRVVIATEVEGFGADGANVTIRCDPAAVVRVLQGGLGWSDDKRCNATYDIEVLEPHAAFGDVRPTWIWGTCRQTDGSVEHARFTVASAETQARYLGQAALEGDEMVAAPEPGSAVGL